MIQTGENTVAVEVYRWSDGSYLEDQDMWRLSGIFRSVELVSVAPVHIRDVFLESDVSPGKARLYATTRIANLSTEPARGHVLEVWLGGQIASSELTEIAAGEELKHIRVSEVQGPRLWSAEIPNLYPVIFVLKDGTGKVVDVRRFDFGFRSVEIQGRQLLVNGVPVTLRGVNRHEHDPDRGRSVTLESMERDVDAHEALQRQHGPHVATTRTTSASTTSATATAST